MRRILAAGLLVLLAAAPAIAQPSTIGPGGIRCPDCAESGQKPANAAFDPSQIEFVANPTPAFYENETIRVSLIARVLQPAPLILDVLDSRIQIVDRNMRVVTTGPNAADGSSDCVLVDPRQAVDLASKAVVSALHFNDIVTADLMMNRNPRMPDDILGATPTVTNVRKAAAPVPFVRTGQVKPACANRSGRLVEYLGPEDGELTTVYNDGAIYHRNGAYLTFTRERLSPSELSDLLHAFRDAHFDAMPTTLPEKQSANRPSLALMAARYQRVALGDGDARLAPLLERIDALADRATSHAHFVLKSAPGVPIVVRPWANDDVDLARLVDTGIRLSDRAPDAWRRPVPSDVLASLPAETNTAGESERDPNRLVYFSQAGRLYRVARPFFCSDVRPCAFRELNAAEVAEPMSGDCAEGTMNCQTFIFPNGRREYKRRDPSLTERSGRLWPQSMGVKLRDVPPNGLTFSKDEYNRHKAIYFAIMKLRQFGPNYMEDGILYAGVRVCLIEEGDDPATCGGTTPTRRDVAPMVGFEPRVVAAGAPLNLRFERIDGQTPPRGAGKSDPQLRIDSPRDGAVVAPGETLQVAVSSPNRTRFDAIVIVMEDLPAGDYGAIPASLPARFAIESRGVLVTGQHKSDVSRAKASLSGVEMR